MSVFSREDEGEGATCAADRARRKEEHESPSRVTLLGSSNDGGQGFSFTFGGMPVKNEVFEFGVRSPEARSATRLDVELGAERERQD